MLKTAYFYLSYPSYLPMCKSYVLSSLAKVSDRPNYSFAIYSCYSYLDQVLHFCYVWACGINVLMRRTAVRIEAE